MTKSNPYEALLRLIDERLLALKLSERKLCINAGIGIDSIRTIRRGNEPSMGKLQAMAPILGVPYEHLTALAVLDPSAPTPGLRPFETVFIRGAVQGGEWRSAIEWPDDEWRAISIPTDPRFQGLERFGLEVRGKSMDLIYPEGTTLICVRYADLGRTPANGERVIVLRRGPGDEFEATVKEYEIDAEGRIILWPRSSQPEFQAIVLQGEPAIGGFNHIPTIASAGDTGLDGGAADVIISAKVIQSIRYE